MLQLSAALLEARQRMVLRHMADTDGAAWSELEQLAKLVRVQSCVAEDAGEGAALEFAVQRHGQRDAPLGMLHADMTPALPRRSSLLVRGL
jgi:hypothetical protein